MPKPTLRNGDFGEQSVMAGGWELHIKKTLPFSDTGE